MFYALHEKAKYPLKLSDAAVPTNYCSYGTWCGHSGDKWEEDRRVCLEI